MSRIRKGLLALAVLSALTMTMPAGAGEHWAYEETRPYDVSAIGLSCTPCLDVYIGGTAFEPLGLTQAALGIADASGLDVPYIACQDLDGNVFCGEDGEPRLEGCGTFVDLTASEVAFDPTVRLTVFISTAAPGCVGAGTTGLVTLFYT